MAAANTRRVAFGGIVRAVVWKIWSLVVNVKSWARVWPGAAAQAAAERLRSARLTMQGWTEEKQTGKLRVWRSSDGDVISLAVPTGPLGLTDLSDEAELRRFSRGVAERRGAGLIEVRTAYGPTGPGFSLIYKRLQRPAYIYTGMLIIPMQDESLTWTIVAGERGITGVREAVVTARLMQAGELTIQDYERRWAQDPYEPAYHGVDRSILRFISDDERYDREFPQHPLSKVRRILAELPTHMEVARQE